MLLKEMSRKRRVSRFESDSYRIIDANINRGKEGLRVCEEIARFHLKSRNTTKQFAHLRHELTTLVKVSRLDKKKLIKERDAAGDVGKTTCLCPRKDTFKEIFIANSQRTKEALRVLEEFLKLFDPFASKKFQKLRFQVYDLEKKTIQRFPSLLDSR